MKRMRRQSFFEVLEKSTLLLRESKKQKIDFSFDTCVTQADYIQNLIKTYKLWSESSIL